MGQRFVVLILFVGLVGICFCGCENQGQKVERLIKELEHRKAKVRANAAMALRRIGTPEAIKAAEGAVPALIQALQDPDIQVRANAIYALDFIGESAKDAVPALMLLLKDQNVRIHAVKCIRAIALRQIGTPEAVKVAESAVPALIQALQDPDIQVRANAIYALRQIGTSEALKAVEEYQSQQ